MHWTHYTYCHTLLPCMVRKYNVEWCTTMLLMYVGTTRTLQWHSGPRAAVRGTYRPMLHGT
jgi:hypothetical protein